MSVEPKLPSIHERDVAVRSLWASLRSRRVLCESSLSLRSSPEVM